VGFGNTVGPARGLGERVHLIESRRHMPSSVSWLPLLSFAGSRIRLALHFAPAYERSNFENDFAGKLPPLRSFWDVRIFCRAGRGKCWTRQ